jgi:hypothetical protein
MDTLPIELITEILKHVSATGKRPSDLCSAACVSRAFCDAASDREVLKLAGPGLLSVPSVMRRPGALLFLDKVRQSGSVDAHYMAGMLRFYATWEWGIGGEMLAKAAQRNHGPALYQCAVALINGSGGTKLDADPEGANELLFRAMALGYRPAGVELGGRIIRGLGVKGKQVELGGRVVRLMIACEFQKARTLAEGLIRKKSRRYPFSSSFLPASLIVDWSRTSIPEAVPNSEQRGWKAIAAAAHETLGCQSQWSNIKLCSASGCGRIANNEDGFSRCPRCRIVPYCSMVCEIKNRKEHIGLNCRFLTLPTDL